MTPTLTSSLPTRIILSKVVDCGDCFGLFDLLVMIDNNKLQVLVVVPVLQQEGCRTVFRTDDGRTVASHMDCVPVRVDI